MGDFKLNNDSKIKTGFVVPGNYFDDLSQKVTARIPQSQLKTIALSHRKTWLFSAAAVLIFAICISITFKSSVIPAETDEAALENYITLHSEISENDLVDLLDEQDIKKMDVSFDIETKDIEDILIQNTNVEQYLID